MSSTNDPFPPSLPGLSGIDSPRLFDRHLESPSAFDMGFSHSMHIESPEFFSASLADSFFNEEAFADSSGQSTVDSPESNGQADHTAHQPAFSQSPQSSLVDSSSESSNQNEKNASSASSHSGLFADDNRGREKRHVKQESLSDYGFQTTEKPLVSDPGISNDAMDQDFDFETAAGSPGPNPSGINSKNAHMHNVDVPYRQSSKLATSFNFDDVPSQSAFSNETPNPFAVSRGQNGWPQEASLSHSQVPNSSGEYVSGAMLGNLPGPTEWSHGNTMLQSDGSAIGSTFNHGSPMFNTHTLTQSQVTRLSKMAELYVEPINNKTRVETQVTVNLTLVPLPHQRGYARLHLPPYTISKPKQRSKSPVQKSSDMLELSATLVCSSAMREDTKRIRALARATHTSSDERSERIARISSGKDEEDNHPRNGAPVEICHNCVQRERKRAVRKKTIKPEEEALLNKDEKLRIIVFNCNEIMQWQSASSLKQEAESNIGQQTAYSRHLPENALHTTFDMRITCYCRHVEEKTGFQVIFTLKDDQNRLVAQEMSSPIMVTDDHKAHGPPPVTQGHNPNFPDTSQFPGTAVFLQEPPRSNFPAPFRTAFSTGNLQGLGQNFNHQFHQDPNPFNTSSFPSQATSATLTPQGVSRPASPSAPSGRFQKRRKASGPVHLPSDLTMTRLHSPQGPTPPGSADTLSPDPLYDTSTNLTTGRGMRLNGLPTYESSNGLPMNSVPSQPSTAPHTPVNGPLEFFSAAGRAPRPQSMENLINRQGIISGPTSASSSRVPSPPGTQIAPGVPPGHAHFLANQLQNIPNPTPLSTRLVIHKIIPPEGPVGGGIDVTLIGSGFSKGLEIMFGGSQATSTTYWGGNTLVCCLPPAAEAGPVEVNFKHLFLQGATLQPKHYFRYVDTREQELFRHAIEILQHKITGTSHNVEEYARSILQRSPGSGQYYGNPFQHGQHQQQTSQSSNTTSGALDNESILLKCLDMVDLSDSPYRAHFNLQGANGQSMLHISASLGYHRLVAGLLARGADPDLRDRNGMSSMHMAALHGYPQIVRKLRSAGGDPNLRSLRAYTPADMTTSREMRDMLNSVDHHSRSRSAGATPLSHRSRASSAVSFRSSWGRRVPMTGFSDAASDGGSADGSLIPSPGSQSTPSAWPRSRRQSRGTDDLELDKTPPELGTADPVIAAAPALSAWRDHLALQIHQFQQSFHRTLPNLQMPNLQLPALPPMTYLPDYQVPPVVRRIGSLVPQRSPRQPTAQDDGQDTKSSENHWWDIIMGPKEAPPAYDEIYPQDRPNDADVEKTAAIQAMGEAFADEKCALNFDQVVGESSSAADAKDAPSVWIVKGQQNLSNVGARDVKRLRSDRKLFFVWIPLLIFVLAAMLRDQVPFMRQIASQTSQLARNRMPERMVHPA